MKTETEKNHSSFSFIYGKNVARGQSMNTIICSCYAVSGHSNGGQMDSSTNFQAPPQAAYFL